MSLTTLVLFGSGLVLVAMTILWLVQLRTRNAGIVDIGWAGGLGSLGILYASLGPGWLPRRILIGVMAALWGFRLAAHLGARLRGRPEEGRYVALREEWGSAGGNVAAKFLLFFLFQGILDVVLSIPFLVSVFDTRPRFTALEGFGVLLWLVAWTGESVADAQLERFKKDESNKGRACRVGLWSLSRHPNYFFEWLIWCGFALFAIDSPWGVAALLSPALILFFLLRVTGIPATEAQALRTKGDDYRDYQRTTSAFVPWFRKTGERA